MRCTRVAVHRLHSAVMAGDINACCAILRQLCDKQHEQQHQEKVKTNTTMTSSSSLLSTSSSSLLCSSTNCSSTLSSSSEEALIGQVLELGKAALSANANLVKDSTVQMLCYSAQRHGRWEEALCFCRHLHESPSPLFLASLLTPENTVSVIEECTRRGWYVDVLNAVRLLEEEECESNYSKKLQQTQTENQKKLKNKKHLSSSHTNEPSSNRWRTALAIASCAEQTCALSEPFTLAILIPYLSANNASVQAHALFDEALAHGVLTDGKLVEQIIRQTAQHGQWASCLYMLDKLNETHETSYLLRHASPTLFEQLIALAPSWEVALRFMKLAITAEVKPTQRSVGLLLQMCEAKGAERAAVEVYDMAVREGMVDCLQLHTDSRHTFLRSFSALQQWEKALEALSWMSSANEASAFAGMTELVELCEKSGQWEAALHVSTRLIESEPLHILPPETTLSILFVYAQLKKWELATDLYSQLIHDARVQLHPLALCAVLQSCQVAKKWEVALNVLYEARKERPRVLIQPLAYRLVLNVCMSCTKFNEVMSVLQLMQEDGIAIDSHCQRLGLRAAAMSGAWQRSLNFLRAIPVHQRTADDRTIVLKAARQVGPLASATVMRCLTKR